MAERIQKILAQRGYGSRRKIEELIASGKVLLNSQVATLGSKASLKDKITLDGKLLNFSATTRFVTRILIYNKPLGEICTNSDTVGRKTVYANLPKLDLQRWIGIGRLDINTSGLYIFTNNGALANACIQPSCEIEREYLVKVRGFLTTEQLKKLQHGITIEKECYKIKKTVR